MGAEAVGGGHGRCGQARVAGVAFFRLSVLLDRCWLELAVSPLSKQMVAISAVSGEENGGGG